MKLIEKISYIQHTIDGLTKKEDNPFFKSKYVDLNAIIEALRPLELEQKISITLPLTNVNGRPALALHIQDLETEDEIETIVTLPDLTDPQKMGSAVTYYKRYALMSYFNLQSLDDDDGNLASGRGMVDKAQKTFIKTINHNDEI